MFGPAGIFFKGFVKHPVMVGAIVPSSRRTIARVLSKVDWERCDLFVEYGPGVGTFCQPVLIVLDLGAPQPCGKQPFRASRGGHDHQVLEDRQARERFGNLKGADHPLGHQQVGGQPRDVLFTQPNAPFIGTQGAGDQIEQR